MNDYPQHMKISELSKYSGTPVTTIRFYIREGMLPEPIKTARTMAYYTQEHVRRLARIKKLKEHNKLQLTTIKEILEKESSENFAPEEQNGVRLTSTRKEIIKTAVELFREKGYGAVNISDIAAKAKIGKGTFYSYFSNKESFFCECLESIFYDIGEDIRELKTETDGLKRLYYRSQHFQRYRDNLIDMLGLARYESFMNDCALKEKRDRALSNFAEPIQRELERIIEQRKRPLKNGLLLAYLFIGAAEYSYYYALNYKKPYKEILKAFWNFFFSPETLTGRETP